MFPPAQILETGLLILAAYLAGCMLGFWLRRMSAYVELQPVPVKVAMPPPSTTLQQQPPVDEFASRTRLELTPAQRLAASIEADSIAAQVAAMPTQSQEVGAVPAPEVLPQAPEIETAATVPAPVPIMQQHTDPIPGRDPGAIAAEAAEEEAASAPPEAPSAGPPRFHGGFGQPIPLAAPREGGKDNLKLIKGIGPRIERGLNDLGVFHFDQIAAWDRKTVVWVETHFSFKGRIDREKWVHQARDLAKGGVKVLKPLRA